MAPRNKQSVRMSVEPLETREVPSVTYVSQSGSNLYVYTDNAPTAVTINSTASGVTVVEGGSGRSWPRTGVSWVGVYGSEGNDRFVNNVTTLAVSFYGYGGADYLEGYNGTDYLHGGEGNDTLVGYGGTDTLVGGGGRDVLKGMAGTDYLYGDGGDDTLVGGDGDDRLSGGNDQVQLVGGAGTDWLYGGYGDDTLVTIDGGTSDTADGEAGRDTIWRDQNGWWPWYSYDASYAERVYNITGFANGADRTLDGDNIADPTDGTNYKNFRNNFLFADAGPSMADVDQGAANDCWLLAPLAAGVNDNRYVGREMVADFGDGTYGVRLGGSFYRVDADLPTVSATSTTPANAGLGVQGSLWVAIVEKAYAIHRTGANTYASIGWGDSIDAHRAFNMANVGGSYYRAGSNSATVANDLYNHWYQVNHSATFCTGAVPAGSPLVGGHCYSVTWIDRDASGNVTRIYLHNPWGPNHNGAAFNPYFSITPAQLAACEVWLRWGTSS